jgi:uncharacterized protein YutE (UPF0331/DUF86 family)
LERVQVAADDQGPDPERAVTWAFYAYENCVIVLAEMHERTWARTHPDKARLARTFYDEKLISRDIGDELEELNGLRKAVAYDEPDSELKDRNLEMLASELEEFIGEVETRMHALRQGRQE